MRVAIYARVSSERQEKEHTIGSQLEALRAYVAQNQMQLVEEFTDEGYSGARLDRPALDRMRDLAEQGGFEVLLTYCADRLARKFVLQALILDELERFGVKVIFLEGGAADDPLSKLMHQITGAVAEFERAKITERYRRGKLYRARCGEIVSPDVPFGYVKTARRDGVAAHAEIEPAEAAIVRRIFEAYVDRGLTVRQIAKQLTLDRTPTPGHAGQWHWSSVDRILREEAYIGTYYYKRKHCVPVEGAYGQKRQRFKCTWRPKEEWIPISVPPIIDLSTFHKAVNRNRDNQAFSPRNLQPGGYLLRKLVRCGHCGASCSAQTSKQTYQGQVHASHYYSCLRTTSGFLKQERCSQRRVRADVLDEWIWEEVSTRLQDPSLVLQAYHEHQIHRQDAAAGKSQEPTQRLEAQIKLANKELSRLLDAYQNGAIELSELQQRRKLVNSKLEMLNREKELLTKIAAEQKKADDLKTGLEEFAALVSSHLRHISFENKQKLLRMVLDKVVVKDWRVDVHYNIPLPKPDPAPEPKVSTKLDLRSTYSGLCGLPSYVAIDCEWRHFGPSFGLEGHIIISDNRTTISLFRRFDLFDQLFNCPKTVVRHTSAPLLEQRMGFLQHCAAQGSPRGTLRRKARELLVVLNQLNLQAEGLVRLDEIEAAADRWAYRQPSHYKLKEAEQAKAHFVSIAQQWLGFLGRLHPRSAPAYLPLVEEFAAHRQRERGLSLMTIRSECGHVREFLSRYWTGPGCLADISSKRIDEAIARKSSQDGLARASLQVYAASLRAFFRHAETKGWCSPGLAASIMAPRVYQQELVPAGPCWETVERLLASTEGDNPVDIRDRAILMLFAVYGWRSEEVQGLQLQDLDGDREVIHILRPKPRRTQQYPLTRTVGEAILRYLREVRRQRPSRQVFLTLRAPYKPLSRSALWKTVSDRLRPLGASIRHHGPHSLRHACATRLLAEGLSIQEIGDHLGHQDPNSTRIYAKVDLAGLREVAEFDLGGLL